MTQYEQLKPTIQIDNNLSLLKDSSQYTCSILIGKNYLSYVLSDASCGIIYLLKHYHFQDKVIAKNDFNEILRDPIFKKVNRVKIAIDSLKSTLIPISYYVEEQKGDYFNLVHELGDEEEIHTQEIKSDLIALFSLKKTTVSFLQSIYANVAFYDASSCLLRTYPSLLSNDLIHSIFICVKDDTISLSIYKTKKLVLHQVFAESTISDNTFYIAHYLRLHEVQKEQVHIFLHGESQRISLVYNELIQYYPHVKYCSRIGNLQYPESLFTQPSHYFFNLFSLLVCE